MSDSVVWTPHQVEFVSDLDQPDLGLAPWAGHRWFAYDLIRWANPSRVVELGSFTGCSFFAFCQAMQDGQIEGELLAFGTWKTEESSEDDGNDVFESFSSVVERRFATVNTRIHRTTSADALDQVADGSVDVLHLDGLHDYETVRNDFMSWIPKLTDGGIMLLHGIAQSSGSGAAQLWQEFDDANPTFAFPHGHGLGVLLPRGHSGRSALLELGHSAWRSYYDHRAGHDFTRRRLTALETAVAEAEESVAAARVLVSSKEDEARAMKQELEAQASALESAESALSGSAEHLARTRHLLGTREAELAETRRALERRERELSLAAAGQRDLQAELAKAIDQRDRLDGERVQAEALVDQLQGHLTILAEDRDAHAERLDAYRKALRPIRWATRPGRKLFSRLTRRSIPEIEAGTTETRESGIFEAEATASTATPDLPLAENAETQTTRNPPVLLDVDWYLTQYPDVARADADPATHWTETGWQEGRDPSPLFSVAFYRERYGHRILGDQSPLENYLDQGLPDGWFISSEHEEGVLQSRPLKARQDEILSDLAIQVPSGARESIPASALGELDAELITFDLWDSILVRTRPADAAALATARRIRVALEMEPDESPTTWELVERRYEIERTTAGPSNGEFLLYDVLSQQLGELIKPGRFDVPTITEELVRAELEDEKSATVPIGEVVLAIERLLSRVDAPKVTVLSEFHFATSDLEELLASHGLTDSRLQVVSSADAGMSSPGRGALLEWVRRHSGVEADRHIHVGDDANTDVAIQNVTGGAAVHLLHGQRRFPAAGELRDGLDDVVEELRVELDNAGRLRCRQQAGSQPRAANRLIEAGWVSSLLPVALVAGAIETAIAAGQDRVHYLGREGLFLARIHDAVSPILAPKSPTTAVHLAVSRQSTFGPSLHQISGAGLADLWRLYPRQTPNDLLQSLGAESSDVAHELRQHDLDVEELIGGIQMDERIRSFIDDSSVAWRLSQINDDRRSNLLGYLGRRIDLEASELVVVSTDWHGAIQDNLARLLPNMKSIGCYLALMPMPNPQPDNVVKYSIGPDASLGESVSFIDPVEAIERPWTPPTPDVIGYRAQGAGGARIEPVLDAQILPEAARNALSLYQDSAVEAAPTVARWIVANGIATDVMRPLVASQLVRYFSDPEPGIADLCFGTQFDTTFGRPSVISFSDHKPDRSWLSDGAGQGFRDRLDSAATSTLWPAGFRRWQPVEAVTTLERALRSNRFH